VLERSSTRVVPKDPVTLAVEDRGQPIAYGVVANISERGACVLTDGSFEVGDALTFALSFPREQRPVQAPARVVWQKREDSRLVRCGLRFELPTTQGAARLVTLIQRVAEK
jgi:Tfp pilus assembly protein PilZ